MGLRKRFEANAIKRVSKRFLRQYIYASKIVYATFSDQIVPENVGDASELRLQQLLLQVCVAKLLGTPLTELGLSISQKKEVFLNTETVFQFEEVIMGTSEIREFVVQTVRMLFYLDMMSTDDSDKFLHSSEGEALTEVLSKYGGEFPQVTPTLYDTICNSVAEKTNTVEYYHDILSGKEN